MNDRARVPFALIGVLVLAGSTSLAPALTATSDHGPPDVDVVMERLTSQARSAIEAGVERGLRRSARSPVTRPANTTFGRVLDENRSFREASKVWIYATVRDRLRSTAIARRNLELSATVPPTKTPASLRRAIDRVTVARAGPEGTAVRVSVGTVTVTARRDGRVVARKRIDPTVEVHVPVLAVHDRVRTFERRLDGGPLEPGLGRRLTAALYALTWARGYAQFAGLPIENVVANRHLSLLANGGVLRTQERVFGRSDPVGRTVHARTALETAVVDVLAVGSPGTLERLRRVRRAVEPLLAAAGDAVERVAGGTSPPSPSETTTVGVNATADRAFYDLLRTFNESIDETFTADVRMRAVVRTRLGGPPHWPVAPSEGCTRVSSDRSEDVAVEATREAPRPVEGDWHLLAAYPRRVEITRKKRRAWLCDGTTVRRTEVATESVHVVLRLEGFHHNGPAPAGPIDEVHEPAGPFEGPNLADVRAAAVDRLVPGAAGLEGMAEAAAMGRDVRRTARISGEWPGPLAEWIYANVARLRETVRDIHVRTTRGDVATFQARPAVRLLEKVRNESTRLVGVPARYENVAHRALIGLRYRYVELVLRRLQRRVGRRQDGRTALAQGLEDRENGSMATLQAAFERRDERTPVSPSPVDMRVHAAPSYLTTENATRAAIPALGEDESLHPLVVRNVNVFQVPYGEFADLFARAVLGPKHVRLGTGGQLLRTARRLAANGSTVASSVPVSALRSGTERALEHVEKRYGFRMDRTGIGTPDGWSSVFESALGRYETVRSRALAVSNRSIVTHLVDLAARRWSDRIDTANWRDRIAVASRVVLQRVLTSREAGPTQPQADGAIGPIREALEAAVADRLGEMAKNASMATLREFTTRAWTRLPSGVPVAPTPGFWYTTVNAWHVQVRGEYARFAVTVPRGTPANPGGTLAYIRDGSSVALDVDGDGHRERLGSAGRVSFGIDTWVAIAVPPYAPGVGDTDGVRNETSPGWPWPSEPPPRSDTDLYLDHQRSP